MKVLRAPTSDGADWLVVVHDLAVLEGRFRRLRPVHVLTFLAQQRVKSRHAHEAAFALSHALKNKLAGVRYHLSDFMQAALPLEAPIYQGHYVQEYESQ